MGVGGVALGSWAWWSGGRGLRGGRVAGWRGGGSGGGGGRLQRFPSGQARGRGCVRRRVEGPSGERSLRVGSVSARARRARAMAEVVCVSDGWGGWGGGRGCAHCAWGRGSSHGVTWGRVRSHGGHMGSHGRSLRVGSVIVAWAVRPHTLWPYSTYTLPASPHDSPQPATRAAGARPSGFRERWRWWPLGR